MKVDPQFEHLLVVDSRDYKLFDSDTDASEVFDPVSDFCQKAAHDRFDKSAGVADESWNDWDESLTARPLEKRFTNPLNFAKWTIGYKWGITRIEEKTIDDARWTYAYAGDELVDARVVGQFC